jgi:hypothetical protein
VFDWQRFGDEAGETGRALLTAGAVPTPPEGPFAEGRAYPLAMDRDRDVAAVSFAALNAYPGIEAGWWCVAVGFTLVDGVWHEAGQDDNSTTQRPFERRATVENSTSPWIDWHSNGSLGGYGEHDGDPPRHRHMFFGIAPTGTARLTITDAAGRERDLRITPWCGPYVAAVEGDYSKLWGYGEDGRLLGSFVCQDGEAPWPEPQPPPGPGWERVTGQGDGLGENIVWQRKL